MRAQNEERRPAALTLVEACSLETGGFKLWPSRFAEARPLAFKPPSGFFPSLRVQAGLLAISVSKKEAGLAPRRLYQ
jgi:hypothetical protein